MRDRELVIYLCCYVMFAAASSFGEPGVQTNAGQQGIKQALSDALRTDGAGVLAKKACDFAVQIGNHEILEKVLQNKDTSIRAYCLSQLGNVSREIAASALISSLEDDSLWIRQKKHGEFVAAQQVYEEQFLSIAAALLDDQQLSINLGIKIEREKLIKKLTTLRRLDTKPRREDESREPKP